MEVLARVAGVTDLLMMQAAILHDTSEDTQTTPHELEEQFVQQAGKLGVSILFMIWEESQYGGQRLVS